MKSYSLQVIDMSDILDELFPEDEDSRDQIIDELAMRGRGADWTFGVNAYSLIHLDECMEFLMTCVDNDICEALTRDKIDEIWRVSIENDYEPHDSVRVTVYVNLEGTK